MMNRYHAPAPRRRPVSWSKLGSLAGSLTIASMVFGFWYLLLLWFQCKI